MNEKRKQIQTLIDEVLKTLDPSDANAAKYRQMFQVMSDEQFADWITKFLADPKSNFRVDIEEFGSTERRIMYANVERAAEKLNLNLFEYVYHNCGGIWCPNGVGLYGTGKLLGNFTVVLFRTNARVFLL